MPAVRSGAEARASSREPAVRMDNVVVLRHLLRRVCEQWVLDGADAALVDRGIAPSRMSLCVIHGDAQDLDATLFEFTDTVVESDELRGSNEGEILRVEKERHVLAGVVRQAHVLRAPVRHYCRRGKGGRCLADKIGHVRFR